MLSAVTARTFCDKLLSLGNLLVSGEAAPLGIIEPGSYDGE